LAKEPCPRRALLQKGPSNAGSRLAEAIPQQADSLKGESSLAEEPYTSRGVICGRILTLTVVCGGILTLWYVYIVYICILWKNPDTHK